MRPWVQAAFLIVWLAPLKFMRVMPSCVFHCYACPLASMSCPIGLIAQFAYLALVPLLVIGVLAVVGAAVGSLACGWACPFGLVQDLLSRVPFPKFRVPDYMEYGRYVVLAILVVAGPLYLGYAGLPKENPLFICNVCPAGAIEGGVPHMAEQALSGQAVEWMSWYKFAIAGAFIAGAMFFHRPWCTVLCPLGGLLAVCNRFSVFHLRFNRARCAKCNLCRAHCAYGVHVETKINTHRCIRCLQCTTCGAIQPVLWAKSEERQ